MPDVLARRRVPSRRASVLIAAAAGLALAVPAPAAARADWTLAEARGPVAPADLEGARALGRVVDPPGRAPLARAAQAPTRVESFADAEGRTIRIGTSLPGADLRPIAAVLAGTVHGDEIAALRVRVVLGADVARFCGGDTTVVACYSPDDERRLASGEMVVPYDRPTAPTPSCTSTATTSTTNSGTSPRSASAGCPTTAPGAGSSPARWTTT